MPKTFAAAISLMLTSFLSIAMFHASLAPIFWLGVTMVMAATVAYSPDIQRKLGCGPSQRPKGASGTRTMRERSDEESVEMRED